MMSEFYNEWFLQQATNEFYNEQRENYATLVNFATSEKGILQPVMFAESNEWSL